MSTVNSALYGIERQALEVLSKEMQKYQETQSLTPSFVQLLKNTHEMILKGAKQRVGLDMANKSPREILVELKQLEAEVEQMIQHEDEMNAQENLQ